MTIRKQDWSPRWPMQGGRRTGPDRAVLGRLGGGRLRILHPMDGAPLFREQWPTPGGESIFCTEEGCPACRPLGRSR